MLIAQALGEYAALSVIIGAASDFSIRLEQQVGEWGTEGLIVLIVGAVLWMMITRNKRL
jgi:hypothetical protein